MTIKEFIREDNEYSRRIWQLVEKRRAEPLTFIRQVSKRPAGYVKCQRHHIIPKCWFRKNNLEIDNSEDNMINLLPGEHLEIHVLMREYFKAIGDKDMYYRMALAIDKLVSGNEKWINAIVNDSKEKQQYLTEYERNLDIAAEAVSYRYKNLSEEERLKLSQKLSDAWDRMDQEKYDKLRKKRSADKKKDWDNPNSKVGSDEWRRHQSEVQKKAWENKSELEKENNRQKHIEYWKKLDKEVKEYHARIAKEQYANIPEPEKIRLNRLNSKLQKERWNSYTEEQKAEFGKSISEGIARTPPDRLKLWRQRQSEARKKYLASLTPEQKKAMSEKRKAAVKGKITMSNEELHKVIWCRPEQQAEWEAKGYVRGNFSKRWNREKKSLLDGGNMI